MCVKQMDYLGKKDAFCFGEEKKKDKNKKAELSQLCNNLTFQDKHLSIVYRLNPLLKHTVPTLPSPFPSVPVFNIDDKTYYTHGCATTGGVGLGFPFSPKFVTIFTVAFLDLSKSWELGT